MTKYTQGIKGAKVSCYVARFHYIMHDFPFSFFIFHSPVHLCALNTAQSRLITLVWEKQIFQHTCPIATPYIDREIITSAIISYL